MLKLALVVVALLAFPSAAQAQQWPEGSIGEQPLTKSSGCLSWPAPPGRAGLCADAPAPDLAKIPPVSVAPGSTLAVRFDQPVSNISSGQGALTQVDANTWTFALPASAVGSQLVGLHAHFPGPDVTGSAMFFAHLAVTSQTVSTSGARAPSSGRGCACPRKARSAPTCASTASAAPPSSRGRSPPRASAACGSTSGAGLPAPPRVACRGRPSAVRRRSRTGRATGSVVRAQVRRAPRQGDGPRVRARRSGERRSAVVTRTFAAARCAAPCGSRSGARAPPGWSRSTRSRAPSPLRFPSALKFLKSR